MANFEVVPVYENTVRQLEDTDLANSDLFNVGLSTMVNNDEYLKQEVEKRLTADSLPDNLLTTNEIINNTNVTLPGFAADARQLNREVPGSFAATVMEAIEQQNNNYSALPQLIVAAHPNIDVSNITITAHNATYSYTNGFTNQVCRIALEELGTYDVRSSQFSISPAKITITHAMQRIAAHFNFDNDADDWHIWLAFGGYVSQNYESLDDVIIDQTIMDTLMDNTFAVDYMVISTNIIMPKVLSSLIAYGALLGSDYALTKILNSNIWKDALSQNSDAIKTRSNYPGCVVYGRTTYGSYHSYTSAFDGNVNSCHLSARDQAADNYIGYRFPDIKMPYKAIVSQIPFHFDRAPAKNILIKGVRDNGTLVDIGSGQLPNSSMAPISIYLDTNESFADYRLYSLDYWSSNAFYGTCSVCDICVI